MERAGSPFHCANHKEEDWMYCVMCRTRVQANDALRRAQSRTVSWPVKSSDLKQPIKDLSTCSIDDAISNIVQYLGSTTRGCKKYFNGQPLSKKNRYDRGHCSRFHVEQDETTNIAGHPLTSPGLEGMSISVAPGTYSITAGEWGGEQTQTHVVKLSAGQSANLDFVF